MDDRTIRGRVPETDLYGERPIFVLDALAKRLSRGLNQPAQPFLPAGAGVLAQVGDDREVLPVAVAIETLEHVTHAAPAGRKRGQDPQGDEESSSAAF